MRENQRSDPAFELAGKNLSRRLVEDVPFGIALEGSTAGDLAYRAKQTLD